MTNYAKVESIKKRGEAKKYPSAFKYACVEKVLEEPEKAIKDFRMEGKCRHKLCDILLIGLFTYLSTGEDKRRFYSQKIITIL